jgi:photosystem II stability/assembly factor-like uncharacterized protein
MRVVLAFLVGLVLELVTLGSRAHAASALKDTAIYENFYGVHIVDNSAWIVGYYGTILHSPDRGLTWELQPSPTKNALFSVRFINPENGWIAGSYGTLLHSTDGGKSWRAQRSDTSEHFFGLALIDETHGWIVGSRGTTMRTENGGKSWASTVVPGDFTFSGVSFVDASRGWIAGEFGVIFRTSDGGKSWVKQKSPVEVSFSSGESRNLFALLFNGVESGYAFGLDGLVLKTRGANTWEIIRQGTAEKRLTGANHLFAAAIFNGHLWATGERGTLLESASDGRQWQQTRAELPRVSLNGIAFGKNGFGLVVGNRGVILRTEDGGVSWKRLKIASLASTKDSDRAP